MADFPRHSGSSPEPDDLREDPELLAALNAAFGEEGVQAFAESDDAVNPAEHCLEELIGQLDQAMDSLGPLAYAPTSEDENRASAAAETRYVVFVTAGQLAALPLSGIAEIDRLPDFTPLPHTPAWCLGIANIRGQVVSVTDLAALTNAPSEANSSTQKVIIARSDSANATTALVVDRVIGIRGFRDGLMKRPDDLSSPLAQFAEQIANFDSRQVLLIEPDRLFAHPDMLPLMADS